MLEEVPHSIWSALLALDILGVEVNLQWTRAHCGVLGNEMVDRVADGGTTFEQKDVPIPLASSVCLIKSSFLRTWWDRLSSSLLGCRLPAVDKFEGSLPRSTRCELFRLRSKGTLFSFTPTSAGLVGLPLRIVLSVVITPRISATFFFAVPL